MSDRMDELLADLAEETRATPVDVERVLAGLELPEPVASRPPPRRWGWPVAVGAGGLLAAAAALLLVGRSGPPEPVDLALSNDGGARVVELGGAVLSVDGVGHLGGTSAAPAVTWERGLLRVDVTPGALDAFTATAPEGTVAVKGTVFTVERDARGLVVGVERGEVEVSCVGAAPVSLHVGDQHACLPTTPGGLLGRAQALRDGGADESEVLATLDLAIGLAPGAALAHELGTQRAVSLQRLGRGGEALDQAEAVLAAGGGPRAAELHRLAADLAAVAGDCPRALVHLDALAAAGAAAPAAAGASCAAR